jgi:hypothetical protein
MSSPFAPVSAAGNLASETARDVWSRFAESSAARRELAEYGTNRFEIPSTLPTLPLPDEPHIAAWAEAFVRAEHVGTWNALSGILLQLRFPVAAGVSSRADYAAVLRRGILSQLPPVGHGASAVDEDGISLSLHATDAGRIPVITCRSRPDFQTLVQACTRRNEPAELPESMGACVVAGYNNWTRVETEWRSAQQMGTFRDRSAFLTHLMPFKERYQDKFMILSAGPYSSIHASTIGLENDDWLCRSLVLRRTHEATHYFTKRVFGSMQNTLFDELLADYAGMIDAFGSFRATTFMRFMGIDSAGQYTGGRLANYRGTPALTDEAFAGLACAVVSAAKSLERFDAHRRLSRPHAPISQILSELARDGLEALLVRDKRWRSNETRSRPT